MGIPEETASGVTTQKLESRAKFIEYLAVAQVAFQSAQATPIALKQLQGETRIGRRKYSSAPPIIPILHMNIVER